MTRVLLLLLAVAGLCCAQPVYEIRGTVMEPGFGGVSGVEVRATLDKQEFRTFTNGRGEYSVRLPSPGRYQVAAVLGDYVLMNITSLPTLNASSPKGEVHFEMARRVRIGGRIVDDSTGDPIEGLRVSVTSVLHASNGTNELVSARSPMILASGLDDIVLNRNSGPPSQPVTDANGGFEFFLMPGSYVVNVASLGVGVNAAYTSEEAKKVDVEYERIYWPGGVSLTDVRPMEMRSGAMMNLGDMRVKKASRYRAHVALPQGECPQGESVRLLFSQRGVPPLVAPTGALPTTACGSHVLLRGLEPGTYAVYAVSDWQGERDNIENAVWGRTEFAIDKENVDVTLDLHHGTVLEGKLKSAEGSNASLARMSIAAQPRGVLFSHNPAVEQFIEWGEEGKFRLAVGLGEQTLVMRSEDGSYINKMSFNGAPVKGLTLDVKSGEKQQLEIELDNKKGTIAGTVDGLARTVGVWSTNDVTPLQASVMDRKFQLNVPPGDYVVNVMDAPIWFESPDVARASGARVVVKAGETASVTVNAH